MSLLAPRIISSKWQSKVSLLSDNQSKCFQVFHIATAKISKLTGGVSIGLILQEK